MVGRDVRYMNNQKAEKGMKNWKIILVCLVISFLFLLICSNNSFLYAFNDNQDVNWYITMGNGLLDGKMPYRDLFEQKGPLVYLVFSILCLFSNAYRAVFFLEVICFSLFLFFVYKIIIKFISSKFSMLSLILVAFLVLTSPYFYVGGGAVEEYCLPIFAYMLLCFLEFVHDRKDFNFLRSLVWGVLIGVLLLSKFTLLFFPLIIFVYMAIYYLKEKKISCLINMIRCFVLGLLIVVLPVSLFFLGKGAFSYLLEVYFYDNIFRYKTNTSIFYNFKNIALKGAAPFIFMIIGTCFYQNKFKHENYKYAYLILFVSSLLFILITGNFAYYCLPLVVFVPLGVAFCLEYIFSKKPNLFNKYIKLWCTVLLFILCLLFGNGTIELNDKKKDYIQFQVAEDIRKINNENPTLFCYKLWDYGFYNALDVVPNVKYYANNLLEEEDFPEMYDAFRSYISNNETEFLLVDKEVYEEEQNFISEYYNYYKTYSYKHYKDNYRSFEMTLILLISK